MKLSPVGTETGQSTQKLPCPLLTMGLALFLPTAVLGDLVAVDFKGRGIGRVEDGTSPPCPAALIQVTDGDFALGPRTDAGQCILSCCPWPGFLTQVDGTSDREVRRRPVVEREPCSWRRLMRHGKHPDASASYEGLRPEVHTWRFWRKSCWRHL